MSDHETMIRTAAQKLAKKYSLPTHIVEEDLWHDLKGEFGEVKESYQKKLWGDQIKTATHPEAPWTLLELNVPPEINTAALDVGRWMEANEVRELWGLALRSELSRETRRLNEACDRIRDMLEGDDGQAWNEAETFLRRIGQPASLDEAKDCPACNGIGELTGDPYTKQFPKCAACDGSGVEGGAK